MGEPCDAVRVSTPGKLILIGEHAAVYGAPAFVTAIGLRLETRLERVVGDTVEFELPQLDVRERLPLDELLAYTAGQRDAWRRYADDPGPETFAALRDGHPGRLARVAVGEAVEALGLNGTGLRLWVESALPFGAGFGSSAAAAVGIATAVAALAGKTPRWSRIGPVAAEVERRQHGSPSGVDAATVFHGGVLEAARHDDAVSFAPVAARPEVLRRIQVLHTGPRGQATGEVVAAVAELRRREPDAFARRLDAMRAATAAVGRVLVADAPEVAELIEPVRAYQRCLDELGVVPVAVADLVARIEARGGAAKLSGAGAIAGDGAGCLLAILPDDDLPVLPDGVEHLRAPLAAEGVRVESRR